MGTTTEKLTYLQGTKDAIKNAIVAKGVEVPEGTTFRGYAEKVGEIQVGGEILSATITLENNTGKNGNLRLVFIDADGHKTKMEGTEWTIVNKKDTIFKYIFWERLDSLPILESCFHFVWCQIA